MDCCDNKNDTEKGGKKMDIQIGDMKIEGKKALLWGIIGLLVLAVVYKTFFGGFASSVGLGANAGQAASAYSGMVGGC